MTTIVFDDESSGNLEALLYETFPTIKTDCETFDMKDVDNMFKVQNSLNRYYKACKSETPDQKSAALDQFVLKSQDECEADLNRFEEFREKFMNDIPTLVRTWQQLMETVEDIKHIDQVYSSLVKATLKCQNYTDLALWFDAICTYSESEQSYLLYNPKTRLHERKAVVDLYIPFHEINYKTNDRVPTKSFIEKWISTQTHRSRPSAPVTSEVEVAAKPQKPQKSVKQTFESKSKDNKIDEEMEEIVNLFFGSDEGMVTIFYNEYAKLNVVTTDPDSKDNYEWSEESKLWEYRSGWGSMKLKIIQILKVVHAKVTTYLLNRIESIKEPELVKTAQANLDKFNKCFKASANQAAGIVTFLPSMVYNKQFEKTLNDCTYVLPIKGGKKINLKTLEISERSREDLYSFSLDVDYIGTETPKIDQFMMEIMCTRIKSKDEGGNEVLAFNPEDKNYKQCKQLLGYSISGDTSEKVFQIWYGAGNNGKSTLTELVTRCMTGNLCKGVDRSIIDAKKQNSGGANSALMATRYLHLGIFNELGGMEFNLNTIKMLTGNDEISARELHKSQITFTPKCKFVALLNDMPKINANDEAGVNRLMTLAFNNQFDPTDITGKAKVKDIKENCLDEFFSWLCNCSKAYFQNPIFEKSDESKAEEKDMLESNDVISPFIAQYYTTSADINHKVDTSDMFALYTNFCTQRQYEALGRNKFFLAIDHKGYARDKKRCTYTGLIRKENGFF